MLKQKLEGKSTVLVLKSEQARTILKKMLEASLARTRHLRLSLCGRAQSDCAPRGGLMLS